MRRGYRCCAAAESFCPATGPMSWARKSSSCCRCWTIRTRSRCRATSRGSIQRTPRAIGRKESVYSSPTAKRGASSEGRSRACWPAHCSPRDPRIRSSLAARPRAAPGGVAVFWETPVDSALSKLKRNVHAPVRVVLWDGREFAFSDTPRVTLRLKDTRAAARLARPDLLSLAEAYIDAEAELEGDVREAIRGAVEIARAMPESIFKSQGPTNARHTKRGDREAIQHHYDVSNEFYQLWLDPRMVYSCAYFRKEGDSLETAQLQKLDHICTKLDLRPGERFLDIGCGWGALAIRAASKYGVDATGITLSENQFQLANQRIREAGLEGRCRVLLQDYRDAPGEGFYDKIASVGMFEHVGLRNLPVYF